ncbi:MAG: hypothetical protein WCW77_00145 [Patescibacteria group bacterium]|jgi:uncharacterized BrkB/YihY/UPF0761 family membrane protein
MGSKYWLDSQTIRNILLAIIPFLALVLKSFGFEFTPNDQNDLIDLIVSLVAAVSGLYFLIKAMIGRFKADRPLRGYKY